MLKPWQVKLACPVAVLHMKHRLVIVLIVVTLVLAGAIWQEIYMERAFEQFGKKIEAVETKGELKLEDVKALREWWKPRHNVLVSFLPHIPLNEVEMTFGELIGALKAEDKDSAVAQLVRLRFTVDGLGDMFNLRVRNII